MVPLSPVAAALPFAQTSSPATVAAAALLFPVGAHCRLSPVPPQLFFFDQPLAAQQCEMGLTQFKQLVRKMGLKRWPTR